MTTIDQQTRRRIMRTGLTALDEERACPGYVLYTPFGWKGEVHLIDLKGEVVHRWDLPYPPAFWGYLLPNGNLFYLGKVADDVLVVTPGWVEKGGVLMEVDWDGEIVWEHRDPYQHHDGRRTSSGGALYLTVERIPDEVAARVKGGIPGSEKHGMWADVLVEVDAGGNRIWEWHAYQHLDPETDVLPPNVRRHEWSHANTIVPLDGDRVLVSFRHISTVGIIDKRSDRFEWKLGHDVFCGQHDPSMLDNGNVLVFDNGGFRKNTHATFSRVIEVDPKTDEIVWLYRDRPTFNFYSRNISGARRLPNGNTLITEGQFGRLFQVTPDGEVVWEYINPHFSGDPSADGWPRLYNWVFRASHYLPDEIPGLR
jgi:hypothetical protein